MVLIGWVSAVIAQLYITVQAFRSSTIKGLLCLIIPGYVLLYATKRDTRQTRALIVWGTGLLAFVIGIVAS